MGNSRLAGLLQKHGLESPPSLRSITIGALAFIVILTGASVWITQKEQDADSAVAHTMQNEDRLSAVLSLMQDAEIGQRGYLLTTNQVYLDPYTKAVDAIGGQLDQLEKGVADNPQQNSNIAVLRSLIVQKLSELRQTVQRRREGDEAGADAVLRSGQGVALMDGIRNILARMRAEEERLMATRAYQARRSAFSMEATIIGLALIAAVLALIALRSTMRRARSAEALRDELMARLNRKLLAVMAADVVGYSRMMEGDEVRTLSRLRRAREGIDQIIKSQGGSIVTTAGDSILAAFDSALSAVDCAVEIQKALAANNADVPENQRLTLRIGINVGDVIVQDGDIFGDTVNVAARLEPLADPGGICVSRAVRDHVRKQRALSFDDLGFQSVKNIAEPVSTFRIRFEDQPPSALAISH